MHSLNKEKAYSNLITHLIACKLLLRPHQLNLFITLKSQKKIGEGRRVIFSMTTLGIIPKS